MDKMFEEIRQKLDELQAKMAEVERLQAENNELRKQLANYNAIAEIITGKNPEKNVETAVDENDDNAKLKEYVNGLANELINHTAENEVQVITELMEHWRDNKPAHSSLLAIRRTINAQSLSEDCLEVIYSFLRTKENDEIGKIKKNSIKTCNLAEALLRADNLSADKVEVALDIVFIFFWKKSRNNPLGAEFRRTSDTIWLRKRFEESNKYVVDKSLSGSFFVTKA